MGEKGSKLYESKSEGWTSVDYDEDGMYTIKFNRQMPLDANLKCMSMHIANRLDFRECKTVELSVPSDYVKKILRFDVDEKTRETEDPEKLASDIIKLILRKINSIDQYEHTEYLITLFINKV
jgi:hypothetical protein